MKVSIIVTHKKGLRYLADALDSIEAQKFKDYETILVVDGDADDLTEITERYAKTANMKTFRLQGKTGVSAARNLGLDKASGEYVYFLDGDDYILSDTISCLADAVKEDDDLVYGRIIHTWFQRSTFHEEPHDEDEETFSRLKELYDLNDIYDFRYKRYIKPGTMTVLSVLYRRDFLNENGIRFNESQIYYADVPFWTSVVARQKGYRFVEDSTYIKRYHNDKEQNPALSQLKDEHRRDYFLDAYREALVCAGGDRRLVLHLQLILTRYFVVSYCYHFRYHWDDETWRGEPLKPFLELFENVDLKCTKGYPFVWNRIAHAAKKKNVKAMRRWTNLRFALKKMKKFFGSRRQFYRWLNLHLFQKFSVKDNWITFESFVGRNYAGQPKYIYQYLNDHYGNKYRYIWITDKKGMNIDGRHTEVRRFGIRYFYYMSRAKFWVNNMRQPVWLLKRENQVMLSTWHGTPLKRLVFDMDDVHSSNPKYKDIVYKQTRAWDYLLSDNPYSTEKFQSCFLFEKEKILEYGYPANDPMYGADRDLRAAKVKELLGIPKDKKVILYAPTWRDDNFYDSGQYKFDLELDINRLKKEFSDEYVLLLRLHYWVVDHLDLSVYGDFTFDGSSYDDITDLYLISDICVTDYSSVFFDYANLRRPILFYTYDLDKYRDVLRGFYLDMEKDLPGPLLFTNDDVVDAIRHIDQIEERYLERYDEFYERFCCRDDGHAAERVVKKVFNPESKGVVQSET